MASSQPELSVDLTPEPSSPPSPPPHHDPTASASSSSLTPSGSKRVVSFAESSTPFVETRLAPLQLAFPMPRCLLGKTFPLAELAAKFGDNPMIPPDVATLSATVTSDGGCIDILNGAGSRAMKRYLDQLYGVSVDVHSPYAATGFVNQHGEDRYRVSLRDQCAPALSSLPTFHETVSKASSTEAPKRRSRMSMHFFKHGTSSSRTHTTVNEGSEPRKTRSNDDLAAIFNGEAHNQAQPNNTGRNHSQSVSSADAPRQVPPILTDPISLYPPGDMFGRVMNWYTPYTYGTQTESWDSQLSFENGKTIFHAPFGAGVSFESPSLKQPLESLSKDRQLQEKQSFESTKTARQVDTYSESTKDDERASSRLSLLDPSNRPSSMLNLRSSVLNARLTSKAFGPPTPEPEVREEEYTLSMETMAMTPYSTKVFDILQTYRGLPQLDRFSPEAFDTTVIKLELSTVGDAAPRDDPRFVMWGEVHTDWDHHEDRSNASSRDSISETSRFSATISSSLSKRRSKAKGRNSDASRISLPGHKVLLAATIERWIAQLTSALNYDELLVFLLCYRTYISEYDLLFLLMTRFHWALQKPVSIQDENVRRIVRVRTFVAIRYWLHTFFTVDFLPNRDLRLRLANWLNALRHDPLLKKNTDGMGIVKRLIKVAKESRAAHIPKADNPKPKKVVQDHVLGKKFAEATQTSTQDDEDSDLDLDFLPEEVRVPEPNGDKIANAHISFATNASSAVSPTGPSSLPLSSFSILQRTDHAPGPVTSSSVPPVLPIQHSVLSRAFVKTISRLSRWTRVLNSRSMNRSPISACADVSAFDIDLNISKDLLTVNGGVEQYLRAAEAKRQESAIQSPQPIPSSSRAELPAPPGLSPPRIQTSGLGITPSETPDDATPVVSHFIPSAVALPSAPGNSSPPPEYTESVQSPYPASIQSSYIEPSSESELDSSEAESLRDTAPSPTLADDELDEDIGSPYDRTYSMSTTSTTSFGVPLDELGQEPTFNVRTPWGFDTTDDVDLSDTSSDGKVSGSGRVPKLKKPLRKLPTRRDFEFAPRPETVSSLGITSRASVVSGPETTGAGGKVEGWQVNALVHSLSDDEEPGGVEDALLRLEGHINPARQQHKASRANDFIKDMRKRMENGDYGYDDFRFPGSDEEEDNTDVSTPPTSEVNDSQLLDHFNQASTPIQMSHGIPPPPGLDPPNKTAKPSPEDVVPLEILQSRLSLPLIQPQPELNTPVSKFGSTIVTPPQVHRSFILGLRTEVLAKHFAMIDRELFMGIKFEELVLDDWAGTDEIDILDWSAYLKDRARWKAEHRYSEKCSALAAVRGRFNLTANFVISEIVLTQPNERHIIVGKFIRVAWKCYEQSNFNTLTAILYALQSEWVARSMRKSSWSRIGIFETRVFRDLKLFTSSTDNFKFLRQATDAIAESKPLHTSSIISGNSDQPQVPSACIPFIGIYLSQLHRLNRLPDLIDPTSPNQAVIINHDTYVFSPLAQPEVFSFLAPLPDSMKLEPLINVHKQRRIAEVIKSLVAGQHLASRVKFETDKRIFNRCLRLRALDGPTLNRVLSSYGS